MYTTTKIVIVVCVAALLYLLLGCLLATNGDKKTRQYWQGIYDWVKIIFTGAAAYATGILVLQVFGLI